MYNRAGGTPVDLRGRQSWRLFYLRTNYRAGKGLFASRRARGALVLGAQPTSGAYLVRFWRRKEMGADENRVPPSPRYRQLGISQRTNADQVPVRRQQRWGVGGGGSGWWGLVGGCDGGSCIVDFADFDIVLDVAVAVFIPVALLCGTS